jgi:hypothetical protein
MLELHKKILGERLDIFKFQCLEEKSGEEMVSSLFFVMEQLEQIYASPPIKSDSCQMIRPTGGRGYATRHRHYISV